MADRKSVFLVATELNDLGPWRPSNDAKWPEAGQGGRVRRCRTYKLIILKRDECLVALARLADDPVAVTHMYTACDVTDVR